MCSVVGVFRACLCECNIDRPDRCMHARPFDAVAGGKDAAQMLIVIGGRAVMIHSIECINRVLR